MEEVREIKVPQAGWLCWRPGKWKRLEVPRKHMDEKRTTITAIQRNVVDLRRVVAGVVHFIVDILELQHK